MVLGRCAMSLLRHPAGRTLLPRGAEADRKRPGFRVTVLPE